MLYDSRPKHPPRTHTSSSQAGHSDAYSFSTAPVPRLGCFLSFSFLESSCLYVENPQSKGRYARWDQPGIVQHGADASRSLRLAPYVELSPGDRRQTRSA